MPFQNEITGGNGALVRPQIQSPDFVSGVSGWRIAKDGSCEFNNATFRGTVLGTSYIQNAAGIFGYDGTPALGNLASSMAAASGTDQFGNKYLGGIAVYAASGQSDGAPFILMDPNTGKILSGQWKSGGWDTTNAGSIAVLDADSGLGIQLAQMLLQTPVNTVFPDAVTVNMSGGLGSKTTGSGQNPNVAIYDTASTSDVDMFLSGSLIKTTPNGSPYTWQTPSYATGFAAGGFSGEEAMQFRKDPFDNLVMSGAVKYTGAGLAAGTNATMFTLPSGYIPKGLRVPAYNSSGSGAFCWVAIQNPGGAVVLGTAGAAVSTNAMIEFSAIIPLGHIS